MSEVQFRKSLREAVRGLFTGVLDVGEFDNAMEKTISRNLKQAWKEGALECGIGEDEYSYEEQKALGDFLVKQYEFIPDFTVAIIDNKKSDSPDLDKLFRRTDLWVNRYLEVQNQAKIMACKDQKLVWRINARGKGCKEHCSSCMRLNGKVKRASYWNKIGIRPQSNSLECGGWRCCCALEVTSEPLSKGRLYW